jgi:hypothetical protein
MIPAKQLIQETEKIQCNDGWIYYRPLEGNRYYVTATRHRAETVSASELRLYLDELARALGGKRRI